MANLLLRPDGREWTTTTTGWSIGSGTESGDSYTIEAWVMTTDPTAFADHIVRTASNTGLFFSIWFYYSAGNALWCVVIEDTLTNSAIGCENVINGQQDVPSVLPLISTFGYTWR